MVSPENLFVCWIDSRVSSQGKYNLRGGKKNGTDDAGRSAIHLTDSKPLVLSALDVAKGVL